MKSTLEIVGHIDRQTNPKEKWGWLESNAKGCLVKKLC
jgi:hypothetical protein